MVDILMGLSACHHFNEITAASVSNQMLFMNIHHGVHSQGRLFSTLKEAFSHHHRFKPNVWGCGVLGKLSCNESGAWLWAVCQSH